MWGHHGSGHGGGHHGSGHGGGHHGSGHGGGHHIVGSHQQYAGYQQTNPNATSTTNVLHQNVSSLQQAQGAYQQYGSTSSSAPPLHQQQSTQPGYDSRYQQQQHGQMQYQPGYAGPISGNRQPPPGVAPDVWGWFQAVDRRGTGQITSDELQQALLNNNWSHFNAETCRIMIGMFDKDGSGTIDINEFSLLWKYIQDWKACFNSFDTDQSGTIDQQELHRAFSTFGYRLSPQFCNLCVRVFDRTNANTMKFDDFIQCCVMLKTLTDSFRKLDTNQNGVINISYEQFMDMVLNNTLSGI